MMAFKFTLICGTLFLVSANSLPNPNQALAEVSIVNVVKRMVRYVEGLLDRILSFVIAALSEMFDNWELYRIKLINTARAVITAALKRGRRFLDRIAEDASDSGKHFITCCEYSENDMMKVPVNFLDRVNRCIKNDVLDLLELLGPLLNDLASVQEESNDAADKIDACKGDDLQGILCVVHVATDWMPIIAKLPEIIFQDLAPIKDDVDKAIQTIVTCTKDKLLLLYHDVGYQILNKIATCAAP